MIAGHGRRDILTVVVHEDGLAEEHGLGKALPGCLRLEVTEAKGIQKIPLGKWVFTASDTRIESRVLLVPPGPVRVTS